MTWPECKSKLESGKHSWTKGSRFAFHQHQEDYENELLFAFI
jgi:hypothetical protein